MTPKEELIFICDEHGIDKYQLAKILNKSAVTTKAWLAPNNNCLMSDKNLDLLKEHLGANKYDCDWRNKRGIDAVIANMYALGRMR